jgi:hypothetical protein
MPEERMPKLIMKWIPLERRKTGRPRNFVICTAENVMRWAGHEACSMCDENIVPCRVCWENARNAYPSSYGVIPTK